MVEGFSDKYAIKLFDSILNGPLEVENNGIKASKKIKGTILQPLLSETIRQNCDTVVAVYISVNSVCWTLINRKNYEVLEWKYHGIDYPDSKKFHIVDILNIAWRVTRRLPLADIYVMKAEATTLRAAGSDPNNPKILAVNLQKAQMISMIVALINARSNHLGLYGTLVGNEKVSTDQTVEMILQNIGEKSNNNSQVYVSELLKSYFRNQKDLQKDMLGHCLLLAMTFMDLCLYKRKESIDKLARPGE
ncbi:unnamed protein product [Diatraea saccharalis]|uniref:Uncharacterized protein n=1 Tax=Diatraea saccharalis TaxID=40085 RepID=A0A9N9R6E3_9NEOP|nr:unnamed protein product [Diatraea saccharalis]